MMIMNALGSSGGSSGGAWVNITNTYSTYEFQVGDQILVEGTATFSNASIAASFVYYGIYAGSRFIGESNLEHTASNTPYYLKSMTKALSSIDIIYATTNLFTHSATVDALSSVYVLPANG